MSKQLKIEDVKFNEYYDAEQWELNANYRNLLKARLTMRRPSDLFGEFRESGQIEYLKGKLLALIQHDLDILNAD